MHFCVLLSSNFILTSNYRVTVSFCAIAPLTTKFVIHKLYFTHFPKLGLPIVVCVLSSTHNEITIMNLNCCSLNARIDALKICLATVDRHSRISCITLQETWCDESTDMTKCILHDNKI